MNPSNEFTQFWERTRRAWAEGRLAPLDGSHQSVARNQTTLEDWTPGSVDTISFLAELKPRQDEWLVGNHEDDFLLTNQRLIIRDHETDQCDIYELPDIVAYEDSGWWTKTAVLILRDGTKRIYKKLDGSIKEKYLLLAKSNYQSSNAKPAPQHPAPPSSPLDTPEASDFIFLTYSRQDWPHIHQHIDRLSQQGHALWYDRAIPGSAEWVGMIEKRILDCRLLLVFLSENASRSKWVRREIQYADSKNKPIVAVVMGDVQLQQGLDLVLSQNQMISEHSPQFFEELLSAIRYAKNRTH